MKILWVVGMTENNGTQWELSTSAGPLTQWQYYYRGRDHVPQLFGSRSVAEEFAERGAKHCTDTWRNIDCSGRTRTFAPYVRPKAAL